MVKSHICRVTALHGTISGKKSVHSSRFQDHKDAQDWGDGVSSTLTIEHKVEILPSRAKPEILAHCGNQLQSVGCPCPDCGTIVRYESECMGS